MDGEDIRVAEWTYRDRYTRLGQAHPETVDAAVAYGAALTRAGHAPEAADWLQKVLPSCRVPQAYALCAHELALACADAGRLDEAVNVGRTALELRRRDLGANHAWTLLTAANLGTTLVAAKRYAEAVEVLEATVAGCRLNSDVRAGTTSRAAHDLALAYAEIGRVDDAVAVGRSALEMRRRDLGADHAFTLTTASNLGCHLVSAGQYGEAIDLLEPTLARCRANPDVDPSALEQVEDLLATARAASKPAEPTKPSKPLATVGPSTRTDDELMAELDSLVGLSEIKVGLRLLLAGVAIRDQKARAGLPVSSAAHHVVLVGNPGTGKTTVARLLSGLLHHAGVLSRGHLVEVSRGDLVRPHFGETEQQLRHAVKNAVGGVLFIDEAYALAPADTEDRDPSRHALDELVRLMEDHRDDLVVALAGYPEPMKRLFESNPGLQSRFPRTLVFPDYDDEELAEIFTRMCRSEGYVLGNGAGETLQRTLASFPRDESFGNARMVRNVFERSRERQEARLSFLLDAGRDVRDDLVSLLPEDIPSPADLDRSLVIRRSTEDVLAELDRLVGLESVKSELRSVLNAARVDHLREERGLAVTTPTRHLVFTGNPGTGKTTVARLVGELYRSVGLLRRGTLVQTGREDLTAKWVAHSEKRAKEVFESALGGVLFIDEAQTLTSHGDGPGNDFARDVVNTLNGLIEDHRDDIVVILAGYPGLLDAFDRINPGWSSRFPTTIHFPDFSIDELCAVYGAIVSEFGLRLAGDARASVVMVVTRAVEKGTFGNARGVRNLVEQARKRQADRLAALAEPSDDELVLLTPEDVDPSRPEGDDPGS